MTAGDRDPAGPREPARFGLPDRCGVFRLAVAASLPYQHVLFWGGLRGALALALALAVPASVAERDAIIVTAFVVVAFSILVQGLTMPWLIRRFALGAERPGAVAAANS